MPRISRQEVVMQRLGHRSSVHALAGLMVLVHLLVAAAPAGAASHREAPLIALDPDGGHHRRLLLPQLGESRPSRADHERDPAADAGLGTELLQPRRSGPLHVQPRPEPGRQCRRPRHRVRSRRPRSATTRRRPPRWQLQGPADLLRRRSPPLPRWTAPGPRASASGRRTWSASGPRDPGRRSSGCSRAGACRRTAVATASSPCRPTSGRGRCRLREPGRAGCLRPRQRLSRLRRRARGDVLHRPRLDLRHAQLPTEPAHPDAWPRTQTTPPTPSGSTTASRG